MTSVPLPLVPGRDGRVLEHGELAAVAARIAGQPELWRPRLDPRATVRTYASLHREPDLEVWAIAWLPENDTGWHDHDSSSGAVHVVDGVLEESVLRLSAPDRRTLHGPGATFTFGPDHIHRVTCAGARAVSIHAYSPALWRLGQYFVDDDGVLRRLPVSYADELRPIDAPVAAAG
jgi:hypothetical protein